MLPVTLVVAALMAAGPPEYCTRGPKFDWREDCHSSITLLGDGYAQVVQLKNPSGSLGVGAAFERPDWQAALFLKKGSIASINNDPKGFAQSVLSPGSANTSVAATMRWYPNPGKEWPAEWWRKLGHDTDLGFNFFAQAGSVDWTVPDPNSTTIPKADLTKSAYLWAAGVGLVVRIWPAWLDVNKVQLTTALSWSTRQISGDAADTDFLTSALGPNRRATFWGPQLDVELRINQVFATATITRLNGHLEGLSRGQMVISIGFQSAINLAKPMEGTPAPAAPAAPAPAAPAAPSAPPGGT